MERLFLSTLLVGVLALAPLALPDVQAQGFRSANDLVQWTADLEPPAVTPGASVRVRYEAQVWSGWKLYALDSPAGRPLQLRYADLPDGLTLAGEPGQAEPLEGYDPNFQADIRYFEGAAQFWQDVSVGGDVAPGTYGVTANVSFMVCDPVQCVPGRTEVPVAVVVNAAASTPEVAAPAETPPASASPLPVPPEEEETAPDTVPDLDAGETADRAAATEQEPASAIVPEGRGATRAGDGLWAFVLLAVGAGLAALLTPCVFPMIPLTVSYFTKHAQHPGGAVRMAFVYGLAIILTFTGLGLLAALWVGAAGAQSIAANPWINLFIGLVFVAFALSLLGLYELRLPSGLLNYFNRQSSERGGLLGVVFMGLTLTLVSFSCTAPFVGGLLAATVQGEWSYPILGMVVFSATFALPFIFFALFPRALSALPRSGGWMNSVKVVLGFVELAAALKFLSNADLVWGWNVLSRPLAIAVSVVIFFLAGLYLIGKLRLAHDAPHDQVGVLRLMVAVAFFGLSLYMVPGLFGASLGRLDAYLPPRQSTDVSLLPLLATASGGQAGDVFDWHEDIEAAFAEAQALGQPVFMDFTGYTCTNCRHMESTVFPRPAVAERFERDFVLLRLYTDDPAREEELQSYQLQLTGTTALPTYAIVDPNARRLLAQQSGVVSVEAFVDFLDDGQDRFTQQLALR